MKEVGSLDLTDTEGDSNSEDQIYDIGAMTSQMIVSVKVSSIPPSNVSESKEMVQNMKQVNTFQSKVSHSTVSPEGLSERWQIGLKQSR